MDKFAAVIAVFIAVQAANICIKAQIYTDFVRGMSGERCYRRHSRRLTWWALILAVLAALFVVLIFV